MRTCTELRFGEKDQMPLKEFIKLLEDAIELHGEDAILYGPGETIGSSRMLLVSGEKK